MINDRLAPLCACALLTVVVTTLLAPDARAAARPPTADGGLRPCRAANRRRYENVPGPTEGVFGGGDGYRDFDNEADDDQAGANEDEYIPTFHADDKPKRGVRVASPPHNAIAVNNNDDGDDNADGDDDDENNNKPPYDNQKKVNSYPAAAAGNGLRMDTTSLFRNGETVELPTYVNVPVTLRCKFVPLDGSDNKFETIVESMYPGHANPAPQLHVPQPPDSHASRLLSQLIGSTNGWRGVVNKAVRPVRRAIDNRLARPVRLANFKDWEAPLPVNSGRRRYVANGDGWWDGSGITGGRRYGGDAIKLPVAALKCADERMQRFRDVRQDRRWLTEEQPEADQEPAERNLRENQLLEPQLTAEQDQPVELVDGQQIDDGQFVEQVKDDRPFEQSESSQSANQLGNGQQIEQFESGQQSEQLERGQSVEPVESGQPVEQVQSGQSIEQSENDQPSESGQFADRVKEDQPFEQLGSSRISDQADDRAAERVDGRMAELVDGRMAEQVDASRAEEQTAKWTTAVGSDYATVFRGIPVKTFMEHVITTPSTA